MLYKTKAVILRIVKYGETSVIATAFTELFGLQSYLVNGVRTANVRSSKASILQPANILDLVVYHREQKNLQRISDMRYSYLYTSLHYDVIKNAVALYIMELLFRVISEAEEQPDLFNFIEQSLLTLDKSSAAASNLPLYFTLKLGALLGFGFNGKFGSRSSYLDLREGSFIASAPEHLYYLQPENSQLTSALLSAPTIEEIGAIKMNKQTRAQLLQAYLEYFKLHLPSFTSLKSPRVLHEILD